MKLRTIIMVIGVLVCVVVFAIVWVIRTNQPAPAASNASPDASSASDRAATSPSSSGREKVPGSSQEAVPNTRQSATNPSATFPNVQGMGKMPGGFDPTAWIRELSEEKQRKVEDTFKEHQACVRARSGSETKDKQIDEETMRKQMEDGTVQRIMEECDRGLKSTLKTVLSAEEYKKFLSSLPQPLPAPSASLGGPTVPVPPK